MLDKAKLIPYFRKAVVLKSPEVETDVAYRFTDEELWDMLVMAIWEHNPAYDEYSYPVNELPFLMLLARKELYYRLATASAPFYPLSAEGAELRKDYRFEHYMSLIRAITKEYDSLLGRYSASVGIVEGVLLKNKSHLRHLQYNDLEKPQFNLSNELYGDEVVLRWTKFKSKGDKFKSYQVYASEDVLDEFTELKEENLIHTETNIHNTSCKIGGLEPLKVYHILVIHESLCGLKGYESLVLDLRGDVDDSK